MNINPDNLIALLKDKKGVLKTLLEIVDRNQKQMEGCQKLLQSIQRKEDPNHSEANIIRCLEVALHTSAKNSADVMNLAQLVLVYAAGDNFTGDVGKMAIKLGKGEEALQTIFEQKLKGS